MLSDEMFEDHHGEYDPLTGNDSLGDLLGFSCKVG